MIEVFISLKHNILVVIIGYYLIGRSQVGRRGLGAAASQAVFLYSFILLKTKLQKKIIEIF